MSKVSAQYLTLPIEICGIEASWRNPDYYKFHKFNHLGWDLNDYVHRATKVQVHASGIGEVIAAGFDAGLGNCIVVKYPAVFNSKTKQYRDVICRYMHLSAIYVKKGDTLYHGKRIAAVGGTGTSAGSIHLHIEFDTNTATPQLSGQVAYKNIANRVINGGDGSTMVDPKYLLNKTPVQALYVWDNSCAVDSDANINTVYYHNLVKFETAKGDSSVGNQATADSLNPESVTTTDKSQKLIFPVNRPYITASPSIGVFGKNPDIATLKTSDAYYQKFNLVHYGIDLYNIGNLGALMYCEGNGTVLEAGKDTCFGNTVIIKYPNVYNHVTKKVQDIVIRHYHLASILVKKGQQVTIDTKMGYYGNTGTYSAGVHLHMECDTDVVNYQYTAGLKYSQNIIKVGNSLTMFNPFEVLYLKATDPENQVLTYDKSSFNGKMFVRSTDINMVQKI